MTGHFTKIFITYLRYEYVLTGWQRSEISLIYFLSWIVKPKDIIRNRHVYRGLYRNCFDTCSIMGPCESADHLAPDRQTLQQRIIDVKTLDIMTCWGASVVGTSVQTRTISVCAGPPWWLPYDAPDVGATCSMDVKEIFFFAANVALYHCF